MWKYRMLVVKRLEVERGSGFPRWRQGFTKDVAPFEEVAAACFSSRF